MNCTVVRTPENSRALDRLGVRSMVWTWTGLCTSTWALPFSRSKSNLGPTRRLWWVTSAPSLSIVNTNERVPPLLPPSSLPVLCAHHFPHYFPITSAAFSCIAILASAFSLAHGSLLTPLCFWVHRTITLSLLNTGETLLNLIYCIDW